MIRPLLLILLVLCVVVIGLAYFIAPKYSLSISVGLGFVFLVNGYFILRVFRDSAKQNAGKVVASFMSGTLGKLSLVSGLFALIFVGVLGDGFFRQPDQAFALMASFFGGYIVYIVLVSIWLILKR